MSRPSYLNLSIVAAQASGIAQSQSGFAAIPLVLNGTLNTGNPGPVTLDYPRRVAITSVGDDRGITWTVTGIARAERGGSTITDTFTGANAGLTVYSARNFLIVTSIVPSGNTAAAVTVGTNGVASTPTYPVSRSFNEIALSLALLVSAGSPAAQVEYTYDDVWNPPSGTVFSRYFTLTGSTNLNANAEATISDRPVSGVRVTVTAAPCTIQAIITQQGF